MLIAIWILAALALALWWLLAWGAATLLGLDPSWVGGFHPKVENMPGSAWLNIWVPGWQALAKALLDLTQALLAWVGSGAAYIVWGLWGLGALLVVGVAAALSLIVKLMRKSPQDSSKNNLNI